MHEADLASTQKHNAREYEAHERPANISASGYATTEFYQDAQNLEQAVARRLQDAKVKQRSDSVVAIEYVVSLSNEAMCELDKLEYSTNSILEHLVDFVRGKHGEDNVVAVSKHFDESNPHAHVIVTPITTKEVRWKNTRGEGVKKENRLCARDYTGDKDKLRDLQSDYFKYITSSNRGMNIANILPKIEFKRGVDARDKRARKEFYSKMTDYTLGAVRKELDRMKKLLQENKLTVEAFDVRKSAIESKISTVSANIEKKAEKDAKIHDKGEKWAKTTKELGL